MKKRIGIYPGSFDPITNGHLDMIKRGLKLFDRLYVVLANHLEKQGCFTLEERMALVETSVSNLGHVEVVVAPQQLTVEFARSLSATAILRGLRSVTDFEYEFSMAVMNTNLNSEIETVFLASQHENMAISSSMIREIAAFSGDISTFVPACVKQALLSKFGR